MAIETISIVKAVLIALLASCAVFEIIRSNPTDSIAIPAASAPLNVAAAATCVTRASIMARAQDWVTKKVPYNQGATYGGYREDCSGFVSMAWQLAKPGLTTFTMHTVATNIKKTDLQPGDAINCDTTHIVIFGGWANAAKTQYTAYYEANPAQGTVKKIAPYPYFCDVSCYHPIRYNKVC